MNRTLLSLLACAFALPALGQNRSDWQMHDGPEVTPSNPLGLIQFNCSPSRHGDICMYSVSTIPSLNDSGWYAAPDPNIINFSIPSRVCQAPISCLAYGDFTYFQTFVTVPDNVAVNTFTIAFSGMDDGARISIFNSAHPTGLVIPGSYVYLGGSGTSDLAEFIVAGEVNRVVVTQVDDCCSANNLRRADVVLNGEIIVTNAPPVAECEGVVVSADDSCSAEADIDAGSYDPDGDPVDISTSPDSPYELGETEVILDICDDSGECDSCDATVTVIDDTPPILECGAYDFAVNDTPVSFTALAEDNCDVTITLSGTSCTAVNGSGRLTDRDCELTLDGDTLTVDDAGGNGTTIAWTATATDSSGNSVSEACEANVLHPGGGSGCNQGIGNGPEGCDPGNSNQGDPANSNDEPGGNGRGKANGRR